MELLAKLGIDWRLLIAQAINFGILLAILTALVYRPLLNLLDSRRERIAKALEDARKIEQQKTALDAWQAEEMRTFDEKTGKLFEQARAQAEETREEIIDAAKREAEQILSRGRQQLLQERQQALEEVQSSFGHMILTVTEKILQREFSAADQKRLLASLEKDIPTLLR